MRHPFDGINSKESMTRRAALGILASSVAGGTAAAQIAVTQALGEGGAAISTRALGEEGARPTTLAVGEEGGPATAAANEAGGPAVPPVTTEPFSEEAGKVFSQAVPGLEDGRKPQPMTQAKGEEGKPVTKAAPGAENGGTPLTDALNENGANVPAPEITSLAIGEEGGNVATMAVNEGGGPTTKAVGEEGGVRPGVAIPIVPVQPNTIELDNNRIQAAWKDLAEKDAAKAVQASALLYGSKAIIPFLTKNLKAGIVGGVGSADEATVAKAFQDLDSDNFEAREKAEADLSKVGFTTLEAVEKILETTKSAEVRMRLLRVRDAIKNPAQINQARRALEILVALRTPEAKELLTELAKGDGKDWLTQNAKAALAKIPN